MVEEVWLHIGTAKSGTSSLQKYMQANKEALSEQGLAYISLGRRATLNELAIAHNKQREDLAEIRKSLNDQIEQRPERIALMSSEMLFGFEPELIYDLLPSLKDRRLKVLVYLRRQDRYIESIYLQKSKNFRFMGSIWKYIDHFKGSGSDYDRFLFAWDRTEAELVPRVLERPRLVGGSVVPDALAQMGLPTEGVVEEREDNVSPGYHRVQLLQAAAIAEVADPRLLQRRLAGMHPQDPADRAPILTLAQRREFLQKFAAGNEALRARFFPDHDYLFDETDLWDPKPQGGIPPFTSDQTKEIIRLLQAIKSL